MSVTLAVKRGCGKSGKLLRNEKQNGILLITALEIEKNCCVELGINMTVGGMQLRIRKKRYCCTLIYYVSTHVSRQIRTGFFMN